MNRQEEALKAFVGLRRTNDLIVKADAKDVRQYGLNLNEFAVLELLFNKGDTPMNQIKDKILIAGSSTSYIVNQLCKKGYVTRRQDKEDRRVTYVCLTAKGSNLIKAIFPKHADAIEEMFACLSDDELSQLRDILKKISQHVSDESNESQTESKTN